MSLRIESLALTKKGAVTIALIVFTSLGFAIYSSQSGFSYKEVIVGLAGVIGGVIVFGGERGIRFGLVLWVLTLALGYRTVEWTPNLRIHPAEILLWLLVGCVFVQRKLVDKNRLSLPWWLWLSLPFWAVAWWPLIAGDAPWDKMLSEFRDFLMIIPLMIVVSVVLQEQRYWRFLFIAFFAVGTWIGLMGVVEYWLPGVTRYFPAFAGSVKTVATADNFERAQFSFWGSAAATFICVLTLPLGIVLGSWFSGSFYRLAIIGAAILQVLAIYIGGYRGIWFVLLLQIVVACILGLRKRGVAMAILAIVIGIGAYQFVPNTHERLATGLAALKGQPIDHSAQDRKDRALQAINDAVSAPFGNGWASAGWVHSDVLQIAANVGLLAALIFVGGYLRTLMRIGQRALWTFQMQSREDFDLSLFISFIAAGALLLMEGVEVLPQLALPVWLVWVLVEIRLRETRAVPRPAELMIPMNPHPSWMPAQPAPQYKANA